MTDLKESPAADSPAPSAQPAAAAASLARRAVVLPTRVFLSLLFWAWLLLTGTAHFLMIAACMPLTIWWDRRRRILHALACHWGWLVMLPMRLLGCWRLRVSGKAHTRGGGPRVYAGNHQSQIDIFAMFCGFRYFKWVSKASVFWTPAIGWGMWLIGYIPLTRGAAASVRRMLERCGRELRAGGAILMFPEGTRARDERLQPFKAGAFKLAHDEGAAICPVVFRGTAQALPKGGWLIGLRARMDVEFLEAIPAATVKTLDPATLADMTRERIAARLP